MGYGGLKLRIMLRSGDTDNFIHRERGTVLLEEFLGTGRHKVRIYVPKKGEKRALLKMAARDRDARSGPGVETTTIYDMNGSYEFEVFDYMESGGMQSSGATVTIYVPGESPQTVSITSEEGNTWHVCTINAGKVSITNYMSTEQATPTAK